MKFARSLVLVALGACLASSVIATVVRERVVTVTIEDDGMLREESRVAILLEHADDVASWRTYRVVLDDNRALERLAAFVEDGTGGTRPIKELERTLHEYAGETVFHSSRRHLLVRYPALTVGSTLIIEQEVAYRPYYPASTIRLGSGVPTEQLVVTVTGGDAAWRWRVDGDTTGLVIESREGGVGITGQAVPAVESLALARDRAGPVLRFGWQRDGTWPDVGRWYQGLLDSLPRDAAAIERQARSLVSEDMTPAERLETLVRFAQDKVRYVAVEVGAGGYRPSPPGETLDRRWGDCKDKSLLLVMLLDAVGIEAYPAVLRAGERAALDQDFASPDQFNHMIVAVPTGDDYTFVDPTQRRGGSQWLHPQTQDRVALLLRPEESTLAWTPLQAAGERRSLSLSLAVDAAGHALGAASLVLRGKPADVLEAETSGTGGVNQDESVRSLFASLLPGAQIGAVSWSAAPGPVPEIQLKAEMSWTGLVQFGARRPSLALPGMLATPEPAMLEDRDTDAMLPVRMVDAAWDVTLPPGWCVGTGASPEVDNPTGRFRQTVESQPGGLRVTRQTELRQRHVAKGELAALNELALAEHRAHRRRIRLQPCDAPD